MRWWWLNKRDGKVVKINNNTYTVVGVLPAGFRYPEDSRQTPQVWISNHSLLCGFYVCCRRSGCSALLPASRAASSDPMQALRTE